MFLGTQFLFAILHSKIGLLTNALSDKSLVLRGRAKVGEEKSKMEASRRQTTTKSRLSKSWKTMILAHSPLWLDIVPIPVQIKPTPFWGDLQKPRTCLPFLCLVPSLASSALCLCHDILSLQELYSQSKASTETSQNLQPKSARPPHKLIISGILLQ